MLLIPKSLFYLCFNSTAWAMLTGEDLPAVTSLVLGACESKLPSCSVVCLPTLPDLLLPVPPGYCDTGVWLAVTMKAWSEESGILGGHRGCFNHEQFYQSRFFGRGAHSSNPRFGQSVMGTRSVLLCFFPITGSTSLFWAASHFRSSDLSAIYLWTKTC